MEEGKVFRNIDLVYGSAFRSNSLKCFERGIYENISKYANNFQ